MRGRRKTIKISEAEWHIMKALWNGCHDHNSGMTLGEIVDALSESVGWSNTTIRTLIIRLSDKGAVKIDRTSGVYRYLPLFSKEANILEETDCFVNRVYDGSYYELIELIIDNNKLTEEEKKKLKTVL